MLRQIAGWTYWLGWVFAVSTFLYKGAEEITTYRVALPWLHATQILETSVLLFLISIATEVYRRGSA